MKRAASGGESLPKRGVAIVRQHQRGVVSCSANAMHRARGSGHHALPSITRDNVSIGVAAGDCFRRVDPVRSIVETEDVSSAIGRITRTALRDVVGRSPLDRVLTDTEWRDDLRRRRPRRER